MRKNLLKVLTVTAALLAMVSCTKTNHSVYMTVYGTASSVQIKYGQGQSLSDAMNKNVTTLNIPGTSMPWTSQTYTVDSSSASVFYLYACYGGTETPNITIKIFDNGQMVQQSNCSGNNCFCQSVDYVAN